MHAVKNIIIAVKPACWGVSSADGGNFLAKWLEKAMVCYFFLSIKLQVEQTS